MNRAGSLAARLGLFAVFLALTSGRCGLDPYAATERAIRRTLPASVGPARA